MNETYLCSSRLLDIAAPEPYFAALGRINPRNLGYGIRRASSCPPASPLLETESYNLTHLSIGHRRRSDLLDCSQLEKHQATTRC